MADVIVNRQRLKELRESKPLTQGQLEMKSGVAQGHISRLEEGKRKNAKISTIGKLATALGVPVSELVRAPTVNGRGDV